MLPILFSLVRSEIYLPPTLNDENFETKINKSKLALVMAIDENNTEVERLMPHFRAAAETFHSGNKCDFFYLDGNNAPHTLDLYNIQFFPSFYVFRNGQFMTEYTGERNSTDLRKYLTRITNKPLVVEIDSQDRAYKFLQYNPIAAILTSDEDTSDDVIEVFQDLAEKFIDIIPFVRSTSTEAAYQFGLQQDQDTSLTNAILIRRSIDDVIVQYPISEIDKTDELEKFIRDNAYPLYRLTEGTLFRDVIHDSRMTVFCFCDVNKKHSLKQVHWGMRQIYDKFKDNFTYAYGPYRQFTQLLNEMGTAGTKEPIWVVANFTENGDVSEKLFIPEGTEITPAILDQLLDQVINSFPIIPVKSEEIPEEDEDDLPNLKKLVGSNFRAVYGSPKDSVTLIAPSATDKTSIDLLQELQAIAYEFNQQKYSRFMFYYINAEKNDIPLDVPKDKPTLILKKRGKGMILPNESNAMKLFRLIVTEAKLNVKVPRKLKFAEENLEL
ncbi:hypothetical protein TVAG_451750 [Trichomonas vaginalis G3]|uniref:Thioredoxin domain-containing protein n=1 Tax=Trichomonas vaginalis (strain ATCC PRA-98 / G3) TaxID=412133 RepID=A2G5I8_TRIV3|nr:hypothetical protein TVAG_451750 [Trichomonas vaginalis G3]|eukprot:XP_001300502.1 hypothetical protein [Trichomonas vaginalis G3]